MQHPKGGRKCARRTPAAFIFIICACKQDDKPRAPEKSTASAQKELCGRSEI